ncbi:MAG: hypothetical protein K0Q59_3726, partial [Paenibacillus sp.]|nr:hypothetical protein [Paenibacillus sp.]
MDWSRAKSIFIVSFLALNLLLGYELWIGKWNAIDDSRESAADVVQELGRIMSSRGIKLTAVVPKETPRMQELTVKRVEGMSDGQMVRVSEPIRSNLFFNKSSLK